MTSDHNLRWDLDSVFPGGSASPELERFLRRLSEDIAQVETRFAQLPPLIDNAAINTWLDFFENLEQVDERLVHADAFCECLTAQDVNDQKAVLIESRVMSLKAAMEKIFVGIEAFAVAADDDVWGRLVNSGRIAEVRFFWDERRRIGRMKMPPDMEKLAVELAVDGYHAWNRLYTRMAGDLRTEFVEEGKTTKLSMGQLATKFSSPDRAIRRQAFEKLEASWESIAPLAAMAFNFQAGYRLSLYRNRHWGSALVEPLLFARLKPETLEAMWAAIDRGVNRLIPYITARKKILGIDDFRWYDQAAPLGDNPRTFSYKEAGDFVIRHLSAFSEELGQFARRAIDNRWIEAENRSGKAAGGFHTGLPLKKESRIFMTFSGNYNEVMTLAHELGHAYHSYVLWERPTFARDCPYNLAETASNFCELLVNDAALHEAEKDVERLILLDRKLAEAITQFCNLRARYFFDTALYRERELGMVARERLDELMVKAQKEAFAGILAEDGYHPLFWASKMHFFLTEAPFYNFPYVFGYLFSVGLCALARQEGQSFSSRYRALLMDTGSMTTEDLACRHLGIDLTADDFWDKAVNLVLADVEPFIKLARDIYS